MSATVGKRAGRLAVPLLVFLVLGALFTMPRTVSAMQAPAVQTARPVERGGEASLVLPDIGQVSFGGINGRTLLMVGLGVCALGLLFGLTVFTQLKNLPVHASMLEVSELIYETCKTYLITQGRFILILWVFIGAVVALYFGRLAPTVDAAGTPVNGYPVPTVLVILLFSLIGIAGSYGV